MGSSQLLNVEDLVVRFYTYEGIVKAIEKVQLFLREGEILGVVGETGCGKTVTGLSILRLVPSPGKIEGGKIYLKTDDGFIDILEKDEKFLEKNIRGRYISIIFQEPGAALNPLYRVGEQIGESLFIHRKSEYYLRALKTIEQRIDENKNFLSSFMLRIQRAICSKLIENPDSTIYSFIIKFPIASRVRKIVEEEIKGDVISIMKVMGFPDPERVFDAYPHELSGGMKQRAVIAMALACNPKIVIADEPTTNLDVTIQAQILNLIKELQKKFGSSIIYITHDFGVVAELCDRVAVMYAGNVCEVADVYEIFKNPLHPYTKALLESIPRPNKSFKSIPGTIPNLINPPSGCRFHPRCPYAVEKCRSEVPRLIEVNKDHFVACHLIGGSGGV